MESENPLIKLIKKETKDIHDTYLKYKQLNRIYILHSNPNTAFKVEEYYIHLKKTIEKDHVRVIPSLETIITILKENNTHITSNSQK